MRHCHLSEFNDTWIPVVMGNYEPSADDARLSVMLGDSLEISCKEGYFGSSVSYECNMYVSYNCLAS